MYAKNQKCQVLGKTTALTQFSKGLGQEGMESNRGTVLYQVQGAAVLYV